MNASKENAREALDGFTRIIESSPSLQTPFRREIRQLVEFLMAAGRKLPTEAAFVREAERRKGHQPEVTQFHRDLAKAAFPEDEPNDKV